MRKIFLLLVLTGVGVFTMAQGVSGGAVHGGSVTRINDLVHTRLELRFDYGRSYAYGKEEITLQPHFYPTDSLTLDAKQMSIFSVGVVVGGVVQPFGVAD